MTTSAGNYEDDLQAPNYLARLSSWANKSNTRRLRRLKLADILSGRTCEPISLREFEAFLAYRTHNLENLQFVVWFQAYRKKFMELAPEVQVLSPGPKTFHRALPHRASAERRLASATGEPIFPRNTVRGRRHQGDESGSEEDYGGGDQLGSPQVLSLPSNRDSAQTWSPLSPFSPMSATPLVRRPDSVATPTTPEMQHSSPYPQLSPNDPHTIYPPSPAWSPIHSNTGWGNPRPSSDPPPTLQSLMQLDPTGQPFRDEAMQIVATFIRPGSKKELALDHVVRDAVLKHLVWNTHPDVFLPAYEVVYDILETTCVPRFLEFGVANINLPKQLYWYAVGSTNVMTGLFICFLVIFLVHTPPEANRCYRLLALPPAALGLMQLYSSWRGFCSQVWRRDARQLHAWELQSIDEASGQYWTKIRDDVVSSAMVNSGYNLELKQKPALLATNYSPTVEATITPIAGKDSYLGGAEGTSPIADNDGIDVSPPVVDISQEDDKDEDGESNEMEERRDHLLAWSREVAINTETDRTDREQGRLEDVDAHTDTDDARPRQSTSSVTSISRPNRTVSATQDMAAPAHLLHSYQQHQRRLREQNPTAKRRPTVPPPLIPPRPNSTAVVSPSIVAHRPYPTQASGETDNETERGEIVNTGIIYGSSTSIQRAGSPTTGFEVKGQWSQRPRVVGTVLGGRPVEGSYPPNPTSRSTPRASVNVRHSMNSNTPQFVNGNAHQTSATPLIAMESGDVQVQALSLNNTRGMNGFRRPPVFGPETVVLDPLIKAAQGDIWRDIFIFGAVSSAMFVAIILSVPAYHR